MSKQSNLKIIIITFFVGAITTAICGSALYILNTYIIPSPKAPKEIPVVGIKGETNKLPKEINSSEWKQYNSTDYTFSYPSDWNIGSELDPVEDAEWTSATLVTVYSPGTVFMEGEPNIELTFTVSALKTSVYNLENSVSSYTTDLGASSFDIQSYPVSYLNSAGKLVTLKGSINGDRKALFIQKDGLIYQVEVIWNPVNPSYEEIADKLISSFQFKDPVRKR